MVECYCCGEQREPSMMAALLCHDEITLCRICLGWLMTRAGGIDVMPTLPVRDMDEATRFCEAAGFDVEHYSDDFAFVHFRDRSVFDLDQVADLDPATNHAGCYVITEQSKFAWNLRLSPLCRSVAAQRQCSVSCFSTNSLVRSWQGRDHSDSLQLTDRAVRASPRSRAGCLRWRREHP